MYTIIFIYNIYIYIYACVVHTCNTLCMACHMTSDPRMMIMCGVSDFSGRRAVIVEEVLMSCTYHSPGSYAPPDVQDEIMACQACLGRRCQGRLELLKCHVMCLRTDMWTNVTQNCHVTALSSSY